MIEVEFIRELDDYGAGVGGTACLVKRDEEFFVVSSIPRAPDHGGPETLAFASDENGKVTDWGDVAGGRDWSREKTIAELAEKGPDASSGGRGIFGDTKPSSERTPGEVIDATISTLGRVVARIDERP